MAWWLGIDTSNYTTSLALFDSKNADMHMNKRLLPVAANQVGLRQADAVFAHVKSLGAQMQELFEKHPCKVDAVGVSVRPRSADGSYMPCFLVGTMLAQSVSAALGVPMHPFSHQEGHVAAALFSANRLDLLHKAPFYAFHVSGGTTDCLQVHAKNGQITAIELLGTSLDLKAGQAIDRIGVKLGLSFPAGPQLEQLAAECDVSCSVKPTIKGLNCCLSGLENQCQKLLEEGREPSFIAYYCLEFIQATLEAMLRETIRVHGKKPIVFAGGVMANSKIRRYFEQKYGALFAQPAYSADNAAGIAVLAARREENNAIV